MAKLVHSVILERFMKNSPIPVMVRILAERILSKDRIDGIFDQIDNKDQYTRELLFSELFELMSQVVLKTFSTVHSAYRHPSFSSNVSLTSIYNKLNSTEPQTSRALVNQTASEMYSTIAALKGKRRPLIENLRVKMLDGNCIEASEQRLKVLREQDTKKAALPGKSLVIYDPEVELAMDVIPCEDGHQQERALLDQLYSHIEKNDVFVMDRNFCVRSFLQKISNQEAYFICRHHLQVPFDQVSDREKIAEIETGEVFEQWIHLTLDGEEIPRKWRCITLKLNKKTRNGDKEIVLLTNLRKKQAPAIKIAEVYRKRWNIETMFQQLESYLHSEINTLGYPRAALFGFCVAVVAYNLMGVIKGAMRGEHGEEKIEKEVSGFYIAGEISRTQYGLDMAIESDEWNIFQEMPDDLFIEFIQSLTENIYLESYKKTTRGPKKPKIKKEKDKKKPHVSTKKLLDLAKKSP